MAEMTSDVVVVGGGLIGLAAAWRIAAGGAAVTVVDPAPVSGASHVAAGMLAPVTEVTYGEERLLALSIASAARYPSFVTELEATTGVDVGYRETGTLVVARDAGDREVLADLHAFQQRLGLASDLLTSREGRRLEPLLAPDVRAALHVPGDHSVDNRRLAQALLEAVTALGRLEPTAAAALLTAGARATGVALADGRTVAAGVVVLAMGPWSRGLPGLPPELAPPVRPVKGEILRLRHREGRAFLDHVVRAYVGGHHVYLVPRADGEVVVGATSEERGFDTTVRAGAVYELLRDAHEVVPGVAELELVEARAGLRPGSPDNAPIVGPSDLPGLLIATGHHRNGVLLTPLTADAVAAHVLGTARRPRQLAAFGPQRFAGVAA